MLDLQTVFIDIRIDYWKLSTLKLDEKIVHDVEKQQIEDIIEKLYVDAKKTSKLVWFSKCWCGNTETEKEIILITLYHQNPKNGNLYICSLLPHRGLR